jgi:hypothetical protein
MFLRSLLPTVAIAGLAAAPAFAQAPTAAPATPPPAHDTVKGASLMSAARMALGGEDKLAVIKRLEIKGSSTQVTAQQTLEGDLTMQVESPDKLKIEREIELPGGSITITQTQGLNGTEVWDVTDGNLPGRLGGGRGGGGFRGGGNRGGIGNLLGGIGGNTQPANVDPARAAQLEELQRKNRQTDLARYLVAFLAYTSEAPAWLGTAVTPKDEKADVLEFSTPDGTATRLFLDITTHLPLMMTYETNAPRNAGGGQGRNGGGRRGGRDGAAGAAPLAQAAEGQTAGAPAAGAPTAGAQGGRRAGGAPQQITMELYLGDYKPEGGVKMPHHITRELGGEIQEEIVVKSVKLNPNFKGNTFTQPK